MHTPSLAHHPPLHSFDPPSQPIPQTPKPLHPPITKRVNQTPNPKPITQQSEDPRLRAALLAAQQAFSSTEARQNADGWEGGPDDQDEDQDLLMEDEETPQINPYAAGFEGADDGDDEVERVLLVGVGLKSSQQMTTAAAARRRQRGWEGEGAATGGREGGYTIEESLEELGRLAETAGLKVRRRGRLGFGGLGGCWRLGVAWGLF